MKSFEEWKAEQSIELELTGDVADERAINMSFTDAYDLEYNLRKIEAAIENSLQSQYNDYVEANTEEETE